MVSADEPLAAGVVDALLAQGTSAVGPTRAGAEIEWNKTFARELLGEVAPEAAPRLHVARDRREVEGRYRIIRCAAGRGQAPGAHRRQGREGHGPAPREPVRRRATTRSSCSRPARERRACTIEEKITGAEFTIQAISDGPDGRLPPSTYDYPFRYDGDQGPGTGGMGSLSMAAPTLPFMSAGALRAAPARSSSA